MATKKILLIKRDKIGDLVLTLPIIEIIKSCNENIQLHLLANTYNGWVVDGNPYIDKLWLYPRVRENNRVNLKAFFTQLFQIIKLRQEQFDWIIVAGGSVSWRANKRARQISTKNTRISAYCSKDNTYGISNPFVEPSDGHEVERIASLLSPLGIQVKSPIKLTRSCYQPRESWLNSAKGFIASQGMLMGHYVMLGIGARRRTRQPSASQVIHWSNLIHQHFGMHTIFTWTPGRRDDPMYPGDDDIASEILQKHPVWLHPYRGDLGTVVGLTWLARTSIYPDSGLMHIAASSPGDVIGLFADIEKSSSPSVWGPIGPRSKIIIAQDNIENLPDELIISALTDSLP